MVANSKEYQRAWYAKNRETELAKGRIRSAKFPKGHRRPITRKSALKCRYGMSIEDYEAMRFIQNEACAICLKQTNLHVDHDHTTGQVRALLCNNCNTMLGMAGDDAETMLRGARYLETFRCL